MKKILFVFAALVLCAALPAHADYAFSGSGSSGTAGVSGDTWTLQYSTDFNEWYWGIPGIGAGTQVWAGPSDVTNLEITFNGLPGGMSIDTNFGSAGCGYDGTTRFSITTSSCSDLWTASVSGNTISFVSTGGPISPGDFYFVNVGLTGGSGTTDMSGVSFDATWSTVPEPASLLAFGAGLAGLATRLRRRK